MLRAFVMYVCCCGYRYFQCEYNNKTNRIDDFCSWKGRIKMNIDIEKRKTEFAVMLDELEADIKTLQNNIMKFRLAMANVDENTDLKKFDDDYDVERGLKYIRLC